MTRNTKNSDKQPTAIKKLPGVVNVANFKDLVKDGNWSPAIQAAFDSINKSNGFIRGGVVYFPPGKYRIDQTVVLGQSKAQWGTKVVGYGAVLIGSKKLDAQPDKNWKKIIKKVKAKSRRTAMKDDHGKGAAILEINNPRQIEGQAYVIEGLSFSREVNRHGIGISIPASARSPKYITFRDIHIYRQNIGMYVNYDWQIYFENCLFRSNKIGVLGQNEFNAVSFVQCAFRRNGTGLQIGPDLRQWASNAIHISGCIFESNRRYGINDLSGNRVIITGCYFEANGNSINIATPWSHTTVDTCHFGGNNSIVDGNKGIIIIDGASDVQLRNNGYATGSVPILIAGVLHGNQNCFDAIPRVKKGVKLPDEMRVASDNGLSYWQYNAQSGQFINRSLIDGHVIQKSSKK